MAFNTMVAIKKKMHNMKMEKENVQDHVDQLEQKLIEQRTLYDKQHEEVLILQKRIAQIQNDSSLAQTQLRDATDKLENTLKLLANAESEVVNLTKKVRSLEEDLEQTETRFIQTSTKLDEASAASDESERGKKVLENRNVADEDRIVQMEKELEMTIIFGEEADRKYEETARRLAIVEVDLERSDTMLAAAESKIVELEEELKVVTNNMKSLEIAEQEAAAREDNYEQMILSITEQLKQAEDRATVAERNVNKLQKEVDRLEDELAGERDKYRLVSSELDQTFTELAGF